jgi:ABC-type Na+ efflux pump permease subunit
LIRQCRNSPSAFGPAIAHKIRQRQLHTNSLIFARFHLPLFLTAASRAGLFEVGLIAARQSVVHHSFA